jgi:hypothetical protein
MKLMNNLYNIDNNYPKDNYNTYCRIISIIRGKGGV